jgi:CRISPR-associated protein Cas1
MHTLAVTEQGVCLHAEGDLLSVRRGQTVLRQSRAGEIEQALLFGRVEVTSGALILLLRRNIDLVLLTADGRFRGRLVGRGAKNVQLRLTQYQQMSDATFCLAVARAIVAGKIRNQRQILVRAQRRLRDDELAGVLADLRLADRRVARCDDIEVLRGLEGQAAALYFGQFGKLLRNDEFQFARRTRRPPRDPVNAMLSFGYAVLGSVLETEVLRCGLDPMLGFFHQAAFGRPSLMLDLLEKFRPLVDSLVLRLVNRRQVAPADFIRRGDKTLQELLAEEPGGAESFPTSAPRDEPAPWEDDSSARMEAENETGAAGEGHDAEPAAGTSAQEEGGANGAPHHAVGVYLHDVGRKIFLKELFGRLRDRLYYPPRDANLELRDILRQQCYHLARVIEGKDAEYRPFVTE